MSSLNAAQTARVTEGVRLLARWSLEHEAQLEAFVDTQYQAQHLLIKIARAADSDAPPGAAGTRESMDALVRQGVERGVAARRLFLAATQHRIAADRLVSDLASLPPDEQHVTAPTGAAVLVADDHADSLELAAMILREAGFVVRTASNGLEAVLAAYEMRPAVILMDVSMPVLDGLEATRLIKAIDAVRNARVIAYSANPSIETTLKDKLFAAVLAKPTPPEILVDTVLRFATLRAEG